MYVLERIKHGFEYVLPSICIEVYKGGISAAGGGGSKGGSSGGAGGGGGAKGAMAPANDFGECHQVCSKLRCAIDRSIVSGTLDWLVEVAFPFSEERDGVQWVKRVKEVLRFSAPVPAYKPHSFSAALALGLLHCTS